MRRIQSIAFIAWHLSACSDSSLVDEGPRAGDLLSEEERERVHGVGRPTLRPFSKPLMAEFSEER